VITGFGRTGSWIRLREEGICRTFITFAKGGQQRLCCRSGE